MKKLSLFMAAIAAAAMAAAPAAAVQAAPAAAEGMPGKGGYVISVNGQYLDGKSLDEGSLRECLEKLGVDMETILAGDCKVVVIPGCPDISIPGNPPGDTETPDKPGAETPDAPGTEMPDEPGAEIPDAPDTDDIPEVPGTGAPDTDTPDVPGTETPDTEQNSFAQEVVRLVNEERAKVGLPGLVSEADIEAAALVRAKEIEVSFSHTRPNGSGFSTALREQGVSFMGAGENIAWGQRTPQEVVTGWMNSEGHRTNILNAKFTKIGVGYYQNAAGVNYWTQLFTY